jgi:hypothetical protein
VALCPDQRLTRLRGRLVVMRRLGTPIESAWEPAVASALRGLPAWEARTYR